MNFEALHKEAIAKVQDKMAVHSSHGWSGNDSPREALSEIFNGVDTSSASCAFIYVSPRHNLQRVAEAIVDRFDCPVVACTTSGEIAPGAGYAQGGIAAAALWGVEASVAVLSDLSNFDENAAIEAINELGSPSFSVGHTVSVLLLDGLARSEERVASWLYRSMPGCPLVGGSAGDDGRYQCTMVFDGRSFREEIGTLMMIRSPAPVLVNAHQHFRATPSKLVITDAEPDARVIREFNGKNAAEEYASVVGKDVGELNDTVFSEHPLLISTPAGQFVRGIQSVDGNGGLRLFCAIEAGVVVSVGEGVEMCAELRNELAPFSDSGTALVLGFDCILRRIEAESKRRLDELSVAVGAAPLLGFSTYGEQVNGLHVNQTLTYAVFRSAA